MFEHFDYHYRLWIIKVLLRAFAPPIVTATIAIRLVEHAGYPLSTLPRLAAYLVGLPALWKLEQAFTRWNDERQARLHGAKLPKLIEGKQIGNIDLLKRFAPALAGGYAGDIIDEVLDEAGVNTARMSLLWSERVITRDPDFVKFMLATGFTSFEKGEQLFLRIRSFLGRGIFASDGDLAKLHRSLARPYFARERISDYNAFRKYGDKVIAILKYAASSGEAIDVQDLFGRFTIDTAGEFLFGKNDFSTLDLPIPTPVEAKAGPKGIATDGFYGGFVRAFEDAQVNILKRISVGQYVWAITQFFNDPQSRLAEEISAYIKPLARRALEQKKAGELKNKEDYDSFLEHLVASTEDVNLIQEQLLNVLLAARDTTAGLLTAACYFLAMQPKVMGRLRQEVLDAYGHSTTPTYENIKKLRYLRAVIDESLRLLPPVPINSKCNKDPVVIPSRDGDLYLPHSGIPVNFFSICIHKRRDLWGEDADEFDPDRWLDIRAKDIAADPFRYIAFNAGPRICIGQQFAYNEASFLLVSILQTFDRFTVAQKECAPEGSYPPDEWKTMGRRKAVEECWPRVAVTLYITGGMWLKMHLDPSAP